MEKLLRLIKIKTGLLIIIVGIGLLLRFFWLPSVPAAMNRDEPAIGYNAFSILKTGRDEWGIRWPLSFKSFGDYKSPLYIYLTTIPVYLFGLNEFSTRFWGALAGFLLIGITYLLTKKILGETGFPGTVLATFLITVSSWAIFYSRFSFEANVALFFNIIAIYLFTQNNFQKLDWLISLIIGLSVLTYSSSLIIWSIFLTFWFIYFISKTFRKKKFLLLVKNLLYIVLIVLVMFKQGVLSGQKSRVTIFNNTQLRLDYNEIRTRKAEENILVAKLFYNQYLYFGKILLNNYFKIFSWNFFFGGGGQHPWHKIPGISHLYPIYIILIPIGLYRFFVLLKINKNSKIFLSLFFLILPIASAITVDNPHATRLLNLFFALTFLAGLGLGWLYNKKRLIAIIFCLLIVFNFLRFTKAYFFDYKNQLPEDLLPGIKSAIAVVEKEKNKADRVIFDNNADGAYIYLLFYTSYPPGDFQSNVKRYLPDTGRLEWVEKIDKYLFVNNPLPDNAFKEIYVIKGEQNLGGREISQIRDYNLDKVYYTISANY